MIEEYLLERTKILNQIIRVNKEKFEHNQIAIVEMNNQIKELDNVVDEASQIFSVKAREDNGFRKQEIDELERKIAAYVSENKDYKKIIDENEKELEIIIQCLNEFRNNVSRETLDGKKTENKQLEFNVSDDKKKEILDKLKLCKRLVEIDGKRVEIEIDNLIKMI